MAVSIRHRYHYGNVLISDSKVIHGDALTSNTIPALLKNGEYCYKPFGGVIDDDSVMGSVQRVKLVNLTGFWWNDVGMGEGINIPVGHAVKGYVLDERYYVAIKDDKPLHWPLPVSSPSRPRNNVAYLKR